jgi:hypothetical protein
MKIVPTTTTTKVKCNLNNANYIIQCEKATVINPNICSFDHKFHKSDLEFLKSICLELGLIPVIEKNTIEFHDGTNIEPKEFDMFNFMDEKVTDNGYEAFINKITSIFEPVDLITK